MPPMTSGAPERPPEPPPRRLLPGGVATGVGSLPGTDALEAARLVADELPDFPHLPELPERGPGADLIGRAAGLLVDLHVDLQPSGWRLVERAGRDERRAAGFLAADLDAVEEVFDGYRGPLKVAVAGPWTLAAGVELPRGGRALGDPGAVRDLAQSLAAAVEGVVATLGRRVPGAYIVVQLDEPSLPAVLAGRIPTQSGFGRLREVPKPDARDGLAVVIDAAHAAGCPVVVHCCAQQLPLSLLGDAGADAVSFDLSVLDAAALDAVGELWDAARPGMAPLFLGALPTGPTTVPGAAVAGTEAVRRLARVLGEPAPELAQRAVLTPACGLAGVTQQQAVTAYRAAREAMQRLLEDAPAGAAPVRGVEPGDHRAGRDRRTGE